MSIKKIILVIIALFFINKINSTNELHKDMWNVIAEILLNQALSETNSKFERIKALKALKKFTLISKKHSTFFNELLNKHRTNKENLKEIYKKLLTTEYVSPDAFGDTIGDMCINLYYNTPRIPYYIYYFAPY